MSDDPASTKHVSDVSTVEAPPTTIPGIVRRLGPGLIVAGSIVGSGELIATTATGAQAGFWLLWLIVIGCVIKVFVQVELGRHAITHGKTTMTGLNDVPGPRINVAFGGGPNSKTLMGNWIMWFWLLMFMASLAQLGGIVGGVGQALAISVPLTDDGREFNEQVDTEVQYQVVERELALLLQREQRGEEIDAERKVELQERVAKLGPKIIETRRDVVRRQMENADESSRKQLAKISAIVDARVEQFGDRPEKVFTAKAPELEDMSDSFIADYMGYGKRSGYDDKIWAAIIAIATAVILVVGRYGFIQTFSTVLVASFTLITIANLIALQSTGEWAITWADVMNGMKFRLTPKEQALGSSPLVTALATFGIIGVGASELVTYPYWCLEKGYGRFTGPRDDSAAWEERARGWLRVMRWDAWCSMVVYTFATIAFYLLGAAILHRIQVTPSGTDMIRTLATMYEPVFGSATQVLFLFGAFAVLYSTFFVANASHARVFPDALRVCGLAAKDEKSYRQRIRVFSGIFPLVCLTVYIFVPKPTTLVLLSGTMQSIMLPMISFAAIYFRYKQSDSRLAPGKLWDVFLWLSAIGMLIAGGWLALTKVFPALEKSL